MAGGVGAAEEMWLVFMCFAARGWAGGGSGLEEAELLGLERKYEVDPFGEEEALGKRELENDKAEEFPVNGIELCGFPLMPFA